MRNGKDCIAMVLAGGRGERLGSLTNYMAKPSVPFGGKYKVIDFTLSNCKHSGIDTIGVLTQYFSMDIHMYINNGRHWNIFGGDCNVFLCPSGINKGYYNGTADAVYKNIDFINQFSPENVLILSGDHVYKMDYRKMLEFHMDAEADVTIASTVVSPEETSRFGILQVDHTGSVFSFEEKPKKAKSNLASMGIYIFRWNVLKKLLIADHNNEDSEHDFGKNILPEMFHTGKQVYAYLFQGYWRDVGTIDGLWEANMDFIYEPERFQVKDKDWKILTCNEEEEEIDSSYLITANDSLVMKPCTILGMVERSLLYKSVIINEGAEIIDSIIMPNVYIGRNVRINKAIVGSGTKIMDDVEIGSDYGLDHFVDTRICSKDISLISPHTMINESMVFKKNSHITMTTNNYESKFHSPKHYDYTANPV